MCCISKFTTILLCTLKRKYGDLNAVQKVACLRHGKVQNSHHFVSFSTHCASCFLALQYFPRPTVVTRPPVHSETQVKQFCPMNLCSCHIFYHGIWGTCYCLHPVKVSWGSISSASNKGAQVCNSSLHRWDEFLSQCQSSCISKKLAPEKVV